KNPKLKNISRSLYCLLLKFAMDKRSAVKVEAAPAPAEDDLDTKVNLNKQDLIPSVQKVERSDQEDEDPTNT
ncbi:unnamed protein product, partial [Brassica oleracea var. botrytis]